MYYIFIENEKLTGCGQCKVLNEGAYNAEVPKELYDDYILTPDKYIVGEKEIEIEVPEYDEQGNPVMIDYEATEVVIDYDEEDNPTGSHEITVIKQKQKTHIETITVPYPVIDPDYEEKSLTKAKAKKYEEAKTKAYVYLESGEALYEFEPNKHIEATDGNIGKFTAYALGFMAGSTAPVVWSTKEDETVTLDVEQVTNILQGLGAVQAQVWTVKFTDYVTEIQKATTVEEVENIEIDYTVEK